MSSSARTGGGEGQSLTLRVREIADRGQNPGRGGRAGQPGPLVPEGLGEGMTAKAVQGSLAQR